MSKRVAMAGAKMRVTMPTTFGEVLHDFLQGRIAMCRRELRRRPVWANERIHWQSQLCAYEHLLSRTDTYRRRHSADEP